MGGGSCGGIGGGGDGRGCNGGGEQEGRGGKGGGQRGIVVSRWIVDGMSVGMSVGCDRS